MDDKVELNWYAEWPEKARCNKACAIKNPLAMSLAIDRVFTFRLAIQAMMTTKIGI